MSRGNGTSGFSPVSVRGILAFLISFSTNPEKESEWHYDWRHAVLFQKINESIIPKSKSIISIYSYILQTSHSIKKIRYTKG